MPGITIKDFRESIYKTKLLVYMIETTNPEKQKKLERMREIADELQRLCDEVCE